MLIFPAKYPAAASAAPARVIGVPFKGQRPQGVTVHYTADRNVARTVRALNERGLGYHVIIDRDGKVTQYAPFTHRLDHAGPSLWRDLSCNRWHIAVSLVSWGEVQAKGDKLYAAWNGAELADKDADGEDIRTRRCNVGGRMAHWDAATSRQVDELYRFLAWCVANGVDVENICGHDEAAMPPGRKVDPGGVLPVSMADLRGTLAAALKGG